MAATYEPIATTTLGSASASVTFSSISGSFTDLILVVSVTNTVAASNFLIRVGNGSVDTGSNYSRTRLTGDGSSASSGRVSNQVYIYAGDVGDSGTPAVNTYHFMNYSNTTTYKTVLSRSNTPNIQLQAEVSLWRSTSAVNIITCIAGANNFETGSTFTLYGIASA